MDTGVLSGNTGDAPELDAWVMAVGPKAAACSWTRCARWLTMTSGASANTRAGDLQFFVGPPFSFIGARASTIILASCIPDSVPSAVSESPRLLPAARSVAQTWIRVVGSDRHQSASEWHTDSRSAGAHGVCAGQLT
jgi:hypothetical protein